MGMDVYGKKPTAAVGEYFRRNVWGWHPLAELCCQLAPVECSPCECWHSNDGDGLNAPQATKLGEKLQALLADGSVKAHVLLRNAELGALPNEPCKLCNGTGIRTDEKAIEHGLHEKRIDDPNHPRFGQIGWCNWCDGRASVRAFSTNYHVDEQDVSEFAEFLMACGGFSIC